MIIRGVDYGYCWDMSGVRGFFGEGYHYHKLWKPFGLTFRGSVFTSKTTTLLARPGNLPLDPRDGISPMELVPACIKVNLLGGYALNAVSLSGPGLEFLLATGRWQARTKPWVFSYMSLAPKVSDRILELREALALLKSDWKAFRAPFVFQQNFTCPNVQGHEVLEVIEEAHESGAVVAEALPGISIVPKLSVAISPVAAVNIASSKYIDGLCCSNTVKWGELLERIHWKKLFDNTGVSPLAKFGGGGLSGKPLLPLVLDWIREVRSLGVYKPIVGGGGILSPADALAVRRAGASAVAVGSMSMLRPWRMQRTINTANNYRPG